MSVVVNPGFALLAAALIIAALPIGRRRVAVLAIGLGATAALLLTPTFGVYGQWRLMGLSMSLYRLDALSAWFGLIGVVAAAALIVAVARAGARLEAAALTAFCGAALTAVFSGDLAMFFLGWQLAALSACALVWAGRTETARQTALIVFTQQSLAGALLLTAAAAAAALQGAAAFDRFEPGAFAGALTLAAILLTAGAPLVHLSVRDGIAQAGPGGFVALAAITPLLVGYGVTRGFAGDGILVWIGAVMALAPALPALIDRAPRRILAYLMFSEIGMILMAAGFGGAQGLTGAAILAAVSCMANLTLALGILVSEARAQPFGRDAPFALGAIFIACIAIAGAPGLGGHIALVATLDAASRDGAVWPGVLICIASAGVLAPIAIRLGTRLVDISPASVGRGDPNPQMLAAMAAGAAFVLFVGLAPNWAIGFIDPGLELEPYAFDRWILSAQLFGGAVATLALLARRGLYPLDTPTPVPDLDRFFTRWDFSRAIGPVGAQLGVLDRAVHEAVAPLTRVARETPVREDNLGRDEHVMLWLLAVALWLVFILGVAFVALA